jgi:hypothetical protein
VAHVDGLGGTPVCRGTPVAHHCFRGIQLKCYKTVVKDNVSVSFVCGVAFSDWWLFEVSTSERKLRVTGLKNVVFNILETGWTMCTICLEGDLEKIFSMVSMKRNP